MSIAKVSYVCHVPGHHNSEGDLAEWCVKSHETGKILSSHMSEEKAKSHLQDMHAHSGSLKTAEGQILKDTRCPLCGYDTVYKEDPKDGAPHIYYCHACNRGFDSLQKTAAIKLAFTSHKYTFIEFVCVNSTSPTATSPLKQVALFNKLKQIEGVYPLVQDWTEDDEIQVSLVAIIYDWELTQDLKKEVLKAAKECGVEVDVEGVIGGGALDEAMSGQKESQVEAPPFSSTGEYIGNSESSVKQGSLKTAVYAEEQWEDILQRKGYTEDETTESAWEDTLYINPQLSDVRVLIHESAEPYYLVELNGEMLEQGTDPEKLWDVLERAPELTRKLINHPRELNDTDRKEMGILATINSGLLRKKEPKMAFGFDPQAQRLYDYEASGNDVVLISPANITKLLQGDEANNFWVSLDQIENDSTMETQEGYLKQIQNLIRSYFDREVKAASKKCVIQVDATSIKKGSVTFVSGVEYKDDRVDKLKFTAKPEKAAVFSQVAAAKVVAQLPEFKLTGSIKLE